LFRQINGIGSLSFFLDKSTALARYHLTLIATVQASHASDKALS
jgi:hypothetical protein